MIAGWLDDNSGVASFFFGYVLVAVVVSWIGMCTMVTGGVTACCGFVSLSCDQCGEG